MTDETPRDQYGRRTWDVAAYAEQTQSKKRKTGDGEAPKKMLADNSSKAFLSHRRDLLSTSMGAVKTFNIINPETTGSSYGRGKRFGFNCPICNLSFRDNLALIDHFNSPQHISKVSSSDNREVDVDVNRATVDQVKSVIETLVMREIKKRNTSEMKVSFAERVQKRKEFEELRRQNRKNKRNLRNKSKVEPIENSELQSIMGFAGFSSTK